MRILMFGGFDVAYARNRVLRDGLVRRGVAVGVCAVDPRRRAAARWPALAWKLLRDRRADALLVPEFRHKDVPLARLAATLGGSDLVVDPLVSRWDTKVGDWGTTRDGTLQSDHNRRLDRAAMRFADLLLCDTPQHAAYYQTAYRVPAARCAVVPVGFDDATFRPTPEPVATPFEVAFAGSYLPLHGVETIAAAAEGLHDAGIRWTLIGGGQTFKAVQAAIERGAPLDVVPWLGPAALAARLARAHVLLGIFGTSPKAARVVPHKVYQGLALGRALVTADTPAIRAFFTPGEHLDVVPAGDAAALAAAVLRLRDDAVRRGRLARAGAALVHARYTPPGVAGALLDAGAAVLGWKVDA